jgi:aspartyl-tRNA synthetase
MKREYIIDTNEHRGETVTVKGWVHARRDMGKLIFIDLRDRSGILQVVFLPKSEAKELAERLRPEFCVAVTGQVNERPEKLRNPNMATGEIEMVAEKLEILNESQTPPFEVDKDTSPVSEELRMKYRYLDLRSERMRRNYTLRSKMISFFRRFLEERRFVEIETPIVTKGTPEGAREFVIPSRVHPGKFYALPQSPQQFKQLLMVAGVDRYFQIARCFRDEDQRGDRQPEFTQLDMEMSFVEQEDVISLTEELMIEMIKATAPEKRIQQVPFPRLTYAEAMEKYGSDRPDLREDKDDPNLLAFCWVIDFPFFEKNDNGDWTFTHNPFSAPQPQHRQWLMDKTNIGEILAAQYDIVLNGYEVGGGSIRNHTPESLRTVYEIMGYDDEQIEAQVGHMLEAFSYGAPPHGGIAPGIDRLAMILAGEPNIREVITFPKTGDARDPMMGAPSELPESQVAEANITTLKE